MSESGCHHPIEKRKQLLGFTTPKYMYKNVDFKIRSFHRFTFIVAISLSAIRRRSKSSRAVLILKTYGNKVCSTSTHIPSNTTTMSFVEEFF